MLWSCWITINSFRMLQLKCQAFYLFELETLLKRVVILNYDGLLENKTFSDENQRFDRIKSIHWYRFFNIGWLAGIDLFTRWFDLFNNKKNERTKTLKEDLVNKGSNLADFVRFMINTLSWLTLLTYVVNIHPMILKICAFFRGRPSPIYRISTF